ncbi:MAG: hypothetical protein P9L92_18385 [Candidatus Electryonea clarkiae]|nr:hypothetical protein [Candidatus Electryonea clarkiae]MDP8287139.1 hypothetical protein [Candidatus Electryonea clarkiae]
MSTSNLRTFIHRLSLPILLFIVILSRLPFQSQEPFGWDSCNYILAIESYRPLEDMPHFPGYFYPVMAVKALNIFVNNPHKSLLLYTLLMSVIVVLLLYYFARSKIAPLLGLGHGDASNFAFAAALLTTFNPFTWFFGEISLLYINGAAAGIVAVWAILSEKRTMWKWVFSAGLIAFLSGIRLEAVFLIFLWFREAIRHRLPIRFWLFSVIAAVAGISLWIVPTAILAGSWEIWLERGFYTLSEIRQKVINEQGGTVLFLLKSLLRMFYWIVLATGAGILLIVFRSGTTIVTLKTLPARFKQIILWWVVPVIVIVLAGHPRAGYLMIIQPALSLVIAAILIKAQSGLLSVRKGLPVIIVLSILYFIVPVVAGNNLLQRIPYTASRIQQNDNHLFSIRQQVQEHISNFTTALIFYDGTTYLWRAAMLDFPEIPVYQVWSVGEKRAVVLGVNRKERDLVPINAQEGLVSFQENIEQLIIFGECKLSQFQEDFPGFVKKAEFLTEYGSYFTAGKR